MSESAQALGIPEGDLTRALILVRDLTIQVLKEGLDPRATRVAIIYLNLVDLHFASQRLNRDQLTALYEVAKRLYDEVRRKP